MQTDPIGYADGMNWYAYVHGDPINGNDPSGQYTCGLQGGCGGESAGPGSPPPPNDSWYFEEHPDQFFENSTTITVTADFFSVMARNELKVQAAAGMDEAVGALTGPGELPNQFIAAGIEIGGTGWALYDAVKTTSKSRPKLAITTATRTHGNSYKSRKPTWVYSLVNKTNGALLKYGITSELNAEERYAKSLYKNYPIELQPIQKFDDRLTARSVEVGYCGVYVAFHGHLPPLSSHC